MSTDREILKQALAGRVGSSGMAADPMTTVKAKHTRVYSFPISNIVQADGTIAAIIETPLLRVPFAGRILSVKVTAPIAVANDASDILTFACARERAAVSSVVAAADTTTTTGIAFAAGLAAFVPKAMTLSATSANLDVVAGDVITMAVSVGGAGKLLNGLQTFCMVDVAIEENGV